MRVRRAKCVVFSMMFWVGCQSKAPVNEATNHKGSEPARTQSAGAVEPAKVETSGEESVGTASGGFVAREWGLVRFVSDGAEVATSAHGYKVKRPVTVKKKPRKPLIYLQARQGFDPSQTLSVKVSLSHGTMREVWPTPGAGRQPKHGKSHTFEDISITVGTPCGKEAAPPLTSPACVSLTDGGVCEAAEMGAYIRTVSDCLDVGGVKTPALVYNAEADTLPLPVRIEQGELSNSSKHTVGPVYVQISKGSYARVTRLDPGESIAVQGLEAIPADAARRESMLRDDLLASGLTEPLASDFLDAWRPDVLAGLWRFQALGWYSASGADTVSTLDITPAPVELHRAMLWSIELAE